MWYTTSTVDDVIVDDDVPVRRLRKPPSQRHTGSKTAQTKIEASDQDTSPVQTSPTLDGFGWAAIWWLLGYLFYGTAGFKLWAIACAFMIFFLPVYMIGSALVIAALYFILFK
ncbi:MAG: hypothetical protein LCH81_03765 [Bacteroidetes bacterium]|nr:hypothetical protein [Bacteroidota bacterium]